jgi:hypothetical protein
MTFYKSGIQIRASWWRVNFLMLLWSILFFTGIRTASIFYEIFLRNIRGYNVMEWKRQGLKVDISPLLTKVRFRERNAGVCNV